MIDEMLAVNEALETARELAKESITQKHTGMLIIEIGFLDGGVRTPTVKDTRVLKVRSKKRDSGL
jgi:hypothetical protein